MTSHGSGFCGGCYAWQERRVGKDVLVWRPQMHSKKPTKLVICTVYPSQNEGQSFRITPKSNRSKHGNYIGWQRIGKTMAVRGWGCLKQAIEGISRQLHLWRPAACLNTGGVFAIGALFCFVYFRSFETSSKIYQILVSTQRVSQGCVFKKMASIRLNPSVLQI